MREHVAVELGFSAWCWQRLCACRIEPVRVISGMKNTFQTGSCALAQPAWCNHLSTGGQTSTTQSLTFSALYTAAVVRWPGLLSTAQLISQIIAMCRSCCCICAAGAGSFSLPVDIPPGCVGPSCHRFHHERAKHRHAATPSSCALCIPSITLPPCASPHLCLPPTASPRILSRLSLPPRIVCPPPLSSSRPPSAFTCTRSTRGRLPILPPLPSRRQHTLGRRKSRPLVDRASCVDSAASAHGGDSPGGSPRRSDLHTRTRTHCNVVHNIRSSAHTIRSSAHTIRSSAHSMTCSAYVQLPDCKLSPVSLKKYPMSLIGSLRGVQANPEPCNSNSNSKRFFVGSKTCMPCSPPPTHTYPITSTHPGATCRYSSLSPVVNMPKLLLLNTLQMQLDSSPSTPPLHPPLSP